MKLIEIFVSWVEAARWFCKEISLYSIVYLPISVIICAKLEPTLCFHDEDKKLSYVEVINKWQSVAEMKVSTLTSRFIGCFFYVGIVY